MSAFRAKGDMVVLEGNSRLAAYHYLAGQDQNRWGKVRCTLLPADIDETPHKGELPRDHAQRLAREKACTVSQKHPDLPVLGSDTLVACGRRILPKAESREVAQQCLQLLSGRRHSVLTAIAVAQGGELKRERMVETVVSFKRLSPQEIQAYLDNGEWQGKAGGCPRDNGLLSRDRLDRPACRDRRSDLGGPGNRRSVYTG